jgi:hypothetical protein
MTMKSDSGNFTHRPRAIDARVARAQATGIGEQMSESLRTGMNRAQRVVDQCAPGCMAAVPVNEGFPARTPSMPLVVDTLVTGAPVVLGTWRRGGRLY